MATTVQTDPTLVPAIVPQSPGRVLVTGGGSGLGAAIVDAILLAGGTPVVLDVAFRQETDARSRTLDVTDRAAVEAVVGEYAEELGGLDAVVAAAGIDNCGRLEDVPGDDWDRVIAVNLLGAVNIVRAALPYLIETHGRVITVASTLALRGVSDATAYCASKFGLLGFSRALAAETAGRIGVTTLIPGGMATPFFDGRPDQYRPGDTSKLSDPAAVARVALFALTQPAGCEVRELLVCPELEDSWP